MTASNTEPTIRLFMQVREAKHYFDGFDDFTFAELDLIETFIDRPLAGASTNFGNVRVALAATLLARQRRESFEEIVEELQGLKAGEIYLSGEDADEADEKPAAGKKRPTKSAADAAEPEPAGTPA